MSSQVWDGGDWRWDVHLCHYNYFKKNNLSPSRCLLRQNLRRTQPSDSALAWMHRLDLPVDPFSSKSQIVLVSSTRKNNCVMLRQSWTTINCTYLVAGHPDPREDGHSACSNNRLLLSPCWWSLHAGVNCVCIGFYTCLSFYKGFVHTKKKKKGEYGKRDEIVLKTLFTAPFDQISPRPKLMFWNFKYFGPIFLLSGTDRVCQRLVRPLRHGGGRLPQHAHAPWWWASSCKL